MTKFIDLGICILKINYYGPRASSTLDVYVTPGCSPVGLYLYDQDRWDLIHALGGNVDEDPIKRVMVAEDL